MQKKIIALAVAGLVSGAAFAQTNVTIYGSLDESYTYAKGDMSYPAGTTNSGDRTFSGITGGQYNGNRLGFKGQEDLGNGLKAIFTYEFGAALEGQGGLAANRQSFVGLDTKVGQFSVGRQYAPSGVLMGRNSAWDIASTTALNNILAQGGRNGSPLVVSTMGTGDNSRWNNSIAFISKDYSGFSARAIYAFSNTVGGNSATGVNGNYEASTSDNGRFGISGSYANGPFNVDLIYQTVLNSRVVVPSSNIAQYSGAGVVSPVVGSYVGDGSDVKEWFIGGAYDFKVVKAFATYQAMSNKNGQNSVYAAAPAAADGKVYGVNSDAKIWSIGATMPVSAAGKVRAEYSDVKFSKNVAGAMDGSSYGVSLGYTHDLSKRTMLYTSISYMDNDNDSAAFGGNNNINVGQAGNSSYIFTSGVRHFF